MVHAIDGVSLQVNPGECLGIVGESGSGKTMTALSIMRLLPSGGSVVGGRIMVDGTDIAALPESGMEDVRGNLIGMIFQDPLTSLNPTMSIGDQIAESVRLHRGASKREALDRAVEVLGLVGMPKPTERVTNYPHQLSGGMRQRVMIAMALACEPKLLIADEPTTALDVTIQKQILELIDSLRQRLSMAVILVTHDLGVIAGRADRVAVMYAGRIVETATTSSLFANPRHPYTEALFEALPEKSAVDATTVKRLYNIPGQPPDLTAPPPGCKFAARCRYARDECRAREPALQAETTAHLFRCFFPVGSPDEARDPSTPFVSVPEERPVIPATPAAALAAGRAGDGQSGDGLGEAATATVPVSGGAAADQLAARELAADSPVKPGQDGSLITVSRLVKNFTVTAGAVLQRKVGQVSAVADVSFAIPAGSTFGLVGESGCGKTTVGRLIVGLEKPDGGSIVIGGRDLASLTSRERRRQARLVQLMFQDSYASMDPRMRVSTILREPMIIQRDGSRAAQAKRVSAMLDEVGLPAAAAERYPHEFSGGQRQRLGLARALMLRPSMIVADEPVSALDVSIQAQILNLMLDLQRDYGLTYLFISHDLSVVRYMSDTIGVMYLGKLVEVGPALDVYNGPIHPYTRGLIDTVPVADPELERAKEHQGVQRRAAVGGRAAVRLPLQDPLPARAGPVRGAGAAAAGVHRRGAPGRLPLPAARARARGEVAPRLRTGRPPWRAAWHDTVPSRSASQLAAAAESHGARQADQVARGRRGHLLAEHPVIHVHAGRHPVLVGRHGTADDDAAVTAPGAHRVLRRHPVRAARAAADDRREVDDLAPVDVLPQPAVIERARAERRPVQRLAARQGEHPQLRSALLARLARAPVDTPSSPPRPAGR